jgi:acetyl esterase/lipase
MLHIFRSLFTVLVFVWVPLTTAMGQEPTQADLRYSSNHERSVMDVWLPRGAQSAPIVVYFHGGGFIGGDKSKIQLRPDFLRLPGRGIAFASVNYPLIRGRPNRNTQSILAVLEATSLAIDFIKANASQLGVDPN